MADIDHSHATMPVESDGVSYSGIVWFGVVLVATAIFCQLLVWGLFKAMDWRVSRSDPTPAPLAARGERPSLENGRWQSGAEVHQAIPLLPSEPVVLREFRQKEEATLHQYDWIDKGAQTVRLPIDRAKDLLLERGLPVRPAAAPAETSTVTGRPTARPALPIAAPAAEPAAPGTAAAQPTETPRPH